MSHVVQINDSAGKSRPDPLILRLSPGEERTLGLRIVNLGDPTNVIVTASDGLDEAVRIDRANHYVVLEETIQITAVMPELEDQLEGYILVKSDQDTIRVPVAMVCDFQIASEDEESAEEEDEDGGYGYDAQKCPPTRRRSQEPVIEEGRREREVGGFREVTDIPRRRVAPTVEPDQDEFNLRAEPRRIRHVDPVVEDVGAEDVDLFEDDGILFYFKGRENLRLTLVPLALILVLVVVLVLTFYAKTLPEFPGALASSMLIVTLIIYGAATLLKA